MREGWGGREQRTRLLLPYWTKLLHLWQLLYFNKICGLSRADTSLLMSIVYMNLNLFQFTNTWGMGTVVPGTTLRGWEGSLSCTVGEGHRLSQFKAWCSWGTRQTTRGHSSRDTPVKTPSSGLHLGEPTGHPARQHGGFFTQTKVNVMNE